MSDNQPLSQIFVRTMDGVPGWVRCEVQQVSGDEYLVLKCDEEFDSC